MEIYNLICGYSLEVLLVALLAFVLTQIIKLPIKKATSKLDESKRKMVNVVILFIPLLISFVSFILLYGIRDGKFFSMKMLINSVSAFVLSLSLYAIFSRILLVIKGICEGKNSINSELGKDTIDYIKNIIKELSKELKLDSKELNKLTSELSKLESLRQLLLGDTVCVDEQKLSAVSKDISDLTQKKSEVAQSVALLNEKLQKYTEKLYKK